MQTTLGERIRAARKRAGMNQEELGEALGGVHRNTVGIWEDNGRVPEGEHLLRLPVILGVSADALLLGAPPITLPESALRELRDWLDRVLPPAGEARGG